MKQNSTVLHICISVRVLTKIHNFFAPGISLYIYLNYNTLSEHTPHIMVVGRRRWYGKFVKQSTDSPKVFGVYLANTDSTPFGHYGGTS